MPEISLAVREIASAAIGNSKQLVMGHGWGQSGAAFLPLAETLRPFANSLLIDFPGFGRSSPPEADWGTAQYADNVYAWLRTLDSRAPLVWIGHSFGGRVGIQLAARHPGILAGMVIIAGAGLPRNRTVAQKIRLAAQSAAVKGAKRFVSTLELDRWKTRFGSVDYRAAGAMRPVFTRVVNEDLTEQAKIVTCPTLLIYGQQDTETPVELGIRLHQLIPRSELAVLERLGHLDILNEGRHQVAIRIRTFLQKLPS